MTQQKDGTPTPQAERGAGVAGDEAFEKWWRVWSASDDYFGCAKDMHRKVWNAALASHPRGGREEALEEAARVCNARAAMFRQLADGAFDGSTLKAKAAALEEAAAWIAALAPSRSEER